MLTAFLLSAGSVPAKAETGDKLDRTGLIQSFVETFRPPVSFYDSRTGKGRWSTSYDFGQPDAPSSRTLPGELEIYSDPAYNEINPFVFRQGLFAIEATKIGDTGIALDAGRQYASGLLTTSKTFAQKYGYFEIEASLPQGAGLWPAFWLAAPLDPANPAPQHPGEIDVMEMLGRDQGKIYCSAHWPLDAMASRQGNRTVAIDVGPTDRLRTYGVLWSPSELVWYVDDVEVARLPNPGLDRPMNILVNLAVGGAWGGDPLPSTPFPADYVIKYVRAYNLPK